MEETFGPGGLAYQAMLKQMGISGKQAKAWIEVHNFGDGQGQVVATADIPAGGTNLRKEAGAGNQIVTREMQEEAKKRSWKELNRFRMDIGDLPRTLF